MAARKQNTKPTQTTLATTAKVKRSAPGRTTVVKKSSGAAKPGAKGAAKPGAKGVAKRAAKSSSTGKAKGGLAAHQQALAELRAFGLAFPEAHTKSPWPGHLDLAVRDKTFAYLNHDGEPLSISCKLPDSCHEALGLPFTTPTAYGLGKSGWVTATFVASDIPPVEFLKAWIEESYRAQAPKRLVHALDGKHPK